MPSRRFPMDMVREGDRARELEWRGQHGAWSIVRGGTVARKPKEELSDLVAGIYEAAVGTAAWTDVVARITQSSGAQRFALAPIKPLEFPPLPVTVHPDVLAPLQAFYTLEMTNPFTAAVTSPTLREGDVVTRNMLIDDRTWRKSDVYNVVTRPADLDEMAVISLYCGSGDVTDRLYLAVFRDAGRPAFTPQDLAVLRRLTPHLRRAAEINLTLRTREGVGRAALHALDTVSAGMILMSAEGTVLHANAAAEALLRTGDGLSAKLGRLRAADAVHTSRLSGMIVEAAASLHQEMPTSGGATLLPRPSGLPALEVTVTPLAPNPSYTVGPAHAAALVMVADPAARARAPHDALRALFGLTAAECRVGLELADGRTPREISDSQQLSLFTVRTHIRNLHDKLGVRHQGQLIRRILQLTLMSRAAPK